MNDLMSFLAKNHDRLVKVDRQDLIRIANQIDALKKEKDKTKKEAEKQAINKNLDGLENVAKTKHYASTEYTSPYADVNNRLILQEAIGLARELLKKS